MTSEGFRRWLYFKSLATLDRKIDKIALVISLVITVDNVAIDYWIIKRLERGYHNKL